MKIAFIGQKGLPAKQGGIERHVAELSTRLAKAGFAVTVYSRPHYTGQKNKSYQGVKLINLPSFNTKHLDAISHSFLATIHACFSNYDVIHYHGVGPSLLSWLPRILKPKTKVVATFHCLDRKHQKWNRLAKLMLALGERAACRFPHQTITVSKTLQKYCDYRFDKPTVYIPSGVSLHQTPANNEILKNYGLVKDNYIFTASRLVKHKGLHTLIAAYQQLKTDKKLIIAGEGVNTYDYVKSLRQLAQGNKNIIFVGEQVNGNLKALFENAYCFVQPSETEGMSLALLEAMTYGLPVIVSDIEENLEVTKDWGLKFKNKDARSLAQKLTLALAEPGKIKAEALLAKKAIDNEYNWSKITEEIIKLYQQPLPLAFLTKLVKINLK